jgi:hypothetical protein
MPHLAQETGLPHPAQGTEESAPWGARRVGKAQPRALQEWHSVSQGARLSAGEGKAQPQAPQERYSVNP